MIAPLLQIVLEGCLGGFCGLLGLEEVVVKGFSRQLMAFALPPMWQQLVTPSPPGKQVPGSVLEGPAGAGDPGAMQGCAAAVLTAPAALFSPQTEALCLGTHRSPERAAAAAWGPAHPFPLCPITT